ncbi:MAG: hypothetical protein IKN55_05380, partial [Oscillospiraceae bacterium]|nr:hypothetical protein [Oscillospiraceae bacterium]
MTNEEIRRMMSLVDERFIEELTEEPDGPSVLEVEPAEIVTGSTPIVKHSPWPALTAAAAAVVLLLPCVWFLTHAKQGLQPGQDVSETAASAETQAETNAPTEPAQEEIQQQLADANAQDFPWQGHVIQAQKIGALKLSYVGMTETFREPESPRYDALWLDYSDSEYENHRMELHYELQPVPDELQAYLIAGNELSTELIGTERLAKPEENGGDTMFVVEYGSYRILAQLSGTTTEELSELIGLLKDAAPEEDSADDIVYGTDSRYISYEEAVAFGSHYIPDKVMGYEHSENPSIMTLNEAEITYTTERERYGDGSERQSEAVTLLYEGNGHQLRFTIAKGDYELPEDMPEIDGWSMKRVVWEPAAVKVEDRLMDYSFFCRNEDVTVTVQGRAMIDEIDAFSQFYELAWQGGKYAAPLTPIRSVSGLNEPDAPWKGEVPELEQIGDFRFSHALFNRFTDSFSNREIIQENIEYSGTIEGTGHSIQLAYTTQTPEELFFDDKVITPEEFDAATILSEERLRNDDAGSIIFVLYTDRYRIVVK